MAAPLYSMTGFARVEGAYGDDSWVWEVRAVNGKSLDIRLRLPPGHETLDTRIRKIVAKNLSRGNLQLNLSIQLANSNSQYGINQDWLKTLVQTGQTLVQDKRVKRARLDGLYAVRGVVEEQISSAADPAFQARNDAILSSLGELIESLQDARAQEGAALKVMLNDIVDDLSETVKAAGKSKGADATYIKAVFEDKFLALISDAVSEDRLAQEAALLAVKADVREELDRLAAHVEQARALINSGSPVGRKLDFLSQEFLREINTLCSKSTDIKLTQIGLEMKSLIEQFREQGANVE